MTTRNATTHRRPPTRRAIRIFLMALLATTSLVTLTAPASAQLLDGFDGVKVFTIQAHGHHIGDVVVVGADRNHPPSGYAAGTEHWTWSTTPWPDAFTLIPTPVVPDYNAHTWQTFPHEHFDLSTTVPMPDVILDEDDDTSYQVTVATPTGWRDQGFMWLNTSPLNGPSMQTWYGVSLTTDLVGNGGPIRFRTATLPAANSVNVYLLDRVPAD